MNDCLFCNIIRGAIPSAQVCADAHTVAFLDIGPFEKGHVLVVPRLHAAWLTDLPEPSGEGQMLTDLLAFQLDRQTDKAARDKHDTPALARRLTDLTLQQTKAEARLKWLGNFLSVAEFLARETRSGAPE